MCIRDSGQAIVGPVAAKVFGFDLPVTLPLMTAFDLAEAPVSAIKGQ